MKLLKNKIQTTIVSLGLLLTFSACSEDNDGSVDRNLFPDSALSASATTILKGESITFLDISTNEPTLYTWNFPGGNPTYSNEASPTVLYEGAGMYDVTLTVRNKYGADEVFLENYIEVTAPPVIDLDFEPLVRFNFDDNLTNSGTLSFNASSAGAATYGIRPGGGGAFLFDGNNPLTIDGYTGINGAGTRSVACWVKTSAPALAGLVHWGASGSFSRSSFKMNKTTGTIRFEYQGGGHNGVTNIADGSWHHIAYTYDGDTIKLYVDGVEDFTISGKVLRTGESGEIDVTIGSQAGGSKFIGSLDDVRIFSEVLTPAQVLILSQIN